ncbi:hypothetical protein AVEN_62672-1 [Araneus ventricosus]|uniref:Uncharacterized protein n=1 Tax=Araneus ventricosus TaxID=182803 RepID=A0A4Y2KYA3_ARAVE|nr:hypothetical protein AVEN_62672-1 [Araneus ventricosus]
MISEQSHQVGRNQHGLEKFVKLFISQFRYCCDRNTVFGKIVCRYAELIKEANTFGIGYGFTDDAILGYARAYVAWRWEFRSAVRNMIANMLLKNLFNFVLRQVFYKAYAASLKMNSLALILRYYLRI